MFQTQNLYQNDEKWKNTKLGNSSETIGSWGCLLTSVTMVLNGIGYNETPDTVNDKMKRAGGFQGALFMPSVVPYVWANCVYRDMQPCESSLPPIAQIDAAVAAGKPVILQVDWSKQAGTQTHFVLVKEKKGNDYILYDPYKYSGDGPTKEVLLTSRYRYNGAKLESEITAVLWFDCYSSVRPEPPKMNKVSVPAEKYTLYAAEDDLALRAEPSVNGYLWKRMLMGTELISLEAKDTTKPKLGVTGQWVQVQDPNGDQGYVAAWYVSDVKGQPSTSTGTSATNLPPGALAFITIAQLAFRSQSVISSDNVIRYLAAGEQLVGLEPAAQAIPKVGIDGVWLKVKDASGREGYVSAKYVKYASGSTAQQQAAATGMSSNGSQMKVKATAEGVALRNQAVVSDATLIKRLPLGTELLILEPAAQAIPKIGRNDQWLKVKDPIGSEGFVAAWFVAR